MTVGITTLNANLVDLYIFLWPESAVPDFIASPTAEVLYYLVAFTALSLGVWLLLKWLITKFFPHLTRHARFSLVMDSRRKFVDLNNRANQIDTPEYQSFYDEFSTLRIECLNRMKTARFRPENYGRMDRLDTFDIVDGPNEYARHIRSMCRKAISVIEETIKKEERHS